MSLDGLQVGFQYDPRVVAGAVYWWLYVWSTELHLVRVKQGLPALSRLTRPPDLADCFHITVGNTKNR